MPAAEKPVSSGVKLAPRPRPLHFIGTPSTPWPCCHLWFLNFSPLLGSKSGVSWKGPGILLHLEAGVTYSVIGFAIHLHLPSRPEGLVVHFWSPLCSQLTYYTVRWWEPPDTPLVIRESPAPQYNRQGNSSHPTATQSAAVPPVCHVLPCFLSLSTTTFLIFIFWTPIYLKEPV